MASRGAGAPKTSSTSGLAALGGMKPHQIRLDLDRGATRELWFLKAFLDGFKHRRPSMKISWLRKSMKNICPENSIQTAPFLSQVTKNGREKK